MNSSKDQEKKQDDKWKIVFAASFLVAIIMMSGLVYYVMNKEKYDFISCLKRNHLGLLVLPFNSCPTCKQEWDILKEFRGSDNIVTFDCTDPRNADLCFDSQSFPRYMNSTDLASWTKISEEGYPLAGTLSIKELTYLLCNKW